MIQVFDGLVEELRANSFVAKVRVDQDHADPREAIFVGNGCRGADDVRIAFHDEAALRTLPQETEPVGPRLIPATDGVQPQPAGNIVFGHYANAHHKVPEGL